MSMPDSVDLPNAENFCRFQITDNRGKCCFIGWKRELFPKATFAEGHKFHSVAVVVAEEMHLMRRHCIWGSGPSAYNDDNRNTTKKLAEWFAKTVERMGYDIS